MSTTWREIVPRRNPLSAQSKTPPFTMGKLLPSFSDCENKFHCYYHRGMWWVVWSGSTMSLDGFPISVWPWISPWRVECVALWQKSKSSFGTFPCSGEGQQRNRLTCHTKLLYLTPPPSHNLLTPFKMYVPVDTPQHHFIAVIIKR